VTVIGVEHRHATLATRRKQSRIVVIDCRYAGTELNAAESGLRRAISHYGQDVDQVIVVVSDGSAIGWRP
jgi:hypothetical protein